MNMLLVGQRSWRIGLSIKNATSCHMAVWHDYVMRRLVEYLVKGGNQWPPEVGGRLFLDWGAFVSRAARVGKKLKGLDARKPAKHGYKSLKMLHILRSEKVKKSTQHQSQRYSDSNGWGDDLQVSWPSSWTRIRRWVGLPSAIGDIGPPLLPKSCQAQKWAAK